MAHKMATRPDISRNVPGIPTDLRNVWLHVKECVNTQPQVGQGQAAKLLRQTWALLTWNAHSRLGMAHDACQRKLRPVKKGEQSKNIPSGSLW
jgi:hypothetical protein